MVCCWGASGIILGMGSANERWCYSVMSSLIGWAHTQNDPCAWLTGYITISQNACNQLKELFCSSLNVSTSGWSLTRGKIPVWPVNTLFLEAKLCLGFTRKLSSKFHITGTLCRKQIINTFLHRGQTWGILSRVLNHQNQLRYVDKITLFYYKIVKICIYFILHSIPIHPQNSKFQI